MVHGGEQESMDDPGQIYIFGPPLVIIYTWEETRSCMTTLDLKQTSAY
jgi:hypothetical protein